MVEYSQSLAKPLPKDMAADEAKRIAEARAAVYGNSAQATDGQRALVGQWQYATEAEREAAREPAEAEHENHAFDDKAAATTVGKVANAAGTAVGETMKATVETAKKGFEATKEAAADPQKTADDAKNAFKRFFDELDVGKVTGGVVGALGAYFISGLFGSGGMMQTVLMLALIPAGALIGSQQLGSTFNGWFGADKEKEPEAGKTPQPPAKGPGQQQTQAAGAAPQPAGALSTLDASLAAICVAHEQRLRSGTRLPTSAVDDIGCPVAPSGLIIPATYARRP